VIDQLQPFAALKGPGVSGAGKPAEASAGSAAVLPLLEVADLTVLLEVNGARRAVLRDVSLALRPGEAVGLVGESGAGKSMTARALGRLLPPGAEMRGSIRFGGAEIGRLAGADLRRYRSQVAMIFQDPRAHVNPVRRIGDFMTEALRTNHAVPTGEARRRAVDMLTQVGIEDGARRLQQYPHQMSGGMLQRVMIAAALLTGPRLHSDPLHPYTAGLAAARPDITRTTPRLRAIPGRPLSAFEAPATECAFAARCTHAGEICRVAVPDLVELDGGVSRCARARELRGQLQAAAGPGGADRVPGSLHQPRPTPGCPSRNRRGAAAAPRLAR
jgi:oligopeptide/dipeptide ABC transporter ATP-binding protein